MIFAVEKARRFLLENGFVITFRKNRRKAVNLNDWITDHRSGKKIANVKIFELCSLGEMYAWSCFYRWSGFDAPEEWLDEIERVNKTMPTSGYLYLVVVTD